MVRIPADSIAGIHNTFGVRSRNLPDVRTQINSYNEVNTYNNECCRNGGARIRKITDDEGFIAEKPMMLRNNPLPIIFSRRDASTQLVCLDFFGLRESPWAQRCLQTLVEQQRVDGTFPSGLDSSQWGMRETIRNTLLLLKVGVSSEGANVQTPERFILENQQPDGGWCENPELTIPFEQVWLSNRRSITWLTADAVSLLQEVGMATQPEYQLAVSWIRSIQNPDGGWPSLARVREDPRSASSDPDSTAQITFLMGELFGEEDPAYRRGKVLFDVYLEECARDAERGYWVRKDDGVKGEIEVYHLTHLFLSWLLDPPRRFQHGYDIRDPRVERIMEILLKLQNVDGGWRPFWAKSSCPIYTVIALKVLVLSEMLNGDDLMPDIHCYAS
jgi:hypothetical protein